MGRTMHPFSAYQPQRKSTLGLFVVLVKRLPCHLSNISRINAHITWLAASRCFYEARLLEQSLDDQLHRPHLVFLTMAIQSKESLHKPKTFGLEGKTHSRKFCTLHDAQIVEDGISVEKAEVTELCRVIYIESGRRCILIVHILYIPL